MKRYFTCENKTASRCHQVTVNKWVIAIEPNHLNGWFIQEQNVPGYVCNPGSPRERDAASKR